MDTRLIAKNATVLGIAGVLAKAITAVVGIFVTRYLGPGPFGDYSAAYAYVGTFILFCEIGISQLMVQEGSRNPSVIARYFGNTLLSKSVIAVLIYGLMLALMIPAGYSAPVQSMIIILGLAVAFNEINQSVYNYYQTKEQMYKSAGFQLLTTALIGALTVVVIMTGLGVVAITATHLVSYIVTSVLLLIALRGKVRPTVNLGQLPAMIKNGLPFGVHRIFYNMYFQLSMLMLSLLSTNIELGIYSAAFRLVLVLVFLPSLMASAIYPVLYKLGVTDKSKHQETIEKFFKFLSGIGIPISALLFVLAEPILVWLYDGKFNESVPIMMIVCWFFTLECMSFALGDVLTTTNKQSARMVIQGAAIALLFALILVLYPRWGIYGAAYGMVAAEAFIFLSYYLTVRLKVYRIKIWRHLPTVIIASAMMGVSAYALSGLHPLISSFVSGLVYLAVIMAIDRDFRMVGTFVLRPLLSKFRA